MARGSSAGPAPSRSTQMLMSSITLVTSDWMRSAERAQRAIYPSAVMYMPWNME